MFLSEGVMGHRELSECVTEVNELPEFGRSWSSETRQVVVTIMHLEFLEILFQNGDLRRGRILNGSSLLDLSRATAA